MGPVNSKILVDSLNDIYKEKITNILSRNTASLTNVINVSQSIIVKINCGHRCRVCPSGLVIRQDQAANINVVTDVTQSQVNEIASMIEADLGNTSSQTYKEVSGFLSTNVSIKKDTEITTRIINRLRDVVRNDITLENVTQVMNNVNINDNIGIEINAGDDFEFGGKDCDIRQNMFLDFTSKSIINMAVKNVMEDQSLIRMVNDAKQDTQIEARGLDDFVKSIFSGLAGMSVVGVIALIVIVKMQGSIIPTDSLTEAAKKSPKTAIFAVLVILVVVSCILYFPIARLMGLWPFNGIPILWKCELVDGKHTGKCVSGEFEKGFKTQEECEKSTVCSQYWGCEINNGKFTGKCAQYTSPVLGPLKTKEECEKAIANNQMCGLKWGGILESDGTYKEPAGCMEYEDPKLGIYKTKKQCEENLSRFRNRWKCSSETCKKVHPNTEWAMFETEEECKKSCKGS
jgi:gas vesicle protein